MMMVRLQCRRCRDLRASQSGPGKLRIGPTLVRVNRVAPFYWREQRNPLRLSCGGPTHPRCTQCRTSRSRSLRFFITTPWIGRAKTRMSLMSRLDAFAVLAACEDTEQTAYPWPLRYRASRPAARPPKTTSGEAIEQTPPPCRHPLAHDPCPDRT